MSKATCVVSIVAAVIAGGTSLWHHGIWRKPVLIDKRGEYWKGTCFAALDEYIRCYTADGYPAEVIKQLED